MKLPAVSGKEVIKALEKEGFFVVSQKGSHVKLRKDENASVTTVIVPNHKTIKTGTLKAILRQASIEPKRFLEVIK